MPVVHLAHGGLSVTICPIAGLAILPDIGIYKCWYTILNGNDYYRSSQVLPGLPWERCVEVEISPVTDIRITLEDAQNMPILIHFQGFPSGRSDRLAQVIRLQAWWRGVLFQKRVTHRERVKTLRVVAMGTHPRLGANSPITVDLLCMLAKIWRV